MEWTELANGRMGMYDHDDNLYVQIGSDGSLYNKDGGLITSGPGGPLIDLAMANQGSVMSSIPDVTSLVATEAANGATLTIATGYSGNDVVEPSVLYDVRAPFFADSNGQNGYEYVLCAGGYNGSNALYENPNLWVSHDGNTWVYVVFTNGIGVPTSGYGGVLTPIIPSGVQGDGLMSDPYLVRGPDGTYFILWNQFLQGNGGTGTGTTDWAIKGMSATSLAGPWSTPVNLVSELKATTRHSSPSAFWDGTQWHIYSVDLANVSSTAITHHTCATKNLLGNWVAKSNLTAALPTGYTGNVWWHLNAYRWGNTHVLIVQDTAAGTSSSGNLWALSSTDNGVTWTVPSAPMLKGSVYYRSAAVFSDRGYGTVVDLFYGLLRTNFLVGRNVSTFTPPLSVSGAKYGGIDSTGLPVNTISVAAARIPLPPYVFGDAVQRVDSASSPGSADSGQAYTVSTGTIGISSKQIYNVAAGNARAATTLTGVADALYTAEFSAVDTSSQQWFIVRFVDASNYVRVGYQNTSGWQIQNIVAGSVTQQVFFFPTLAVANLDVVGLLCLGQKISVYVNGVLIGSVTNYANNVAGSGIGVQFTNITNARFRHLTVRTLTAGA